MNTVVEAIIQDLSTIKMENVFNPYADYCDLHDRCDAPLQRQRNLASTLDAALDLRVRTVWIARDLGYRGGRRTGLALTDEVHLGSLSFLYNGLTVKKATKGPVVGERTAKFIWKMLLQISQPVFLWNVFPFHPHRSNEPMSNRPHSAKERDICRRFLYRIVDLLQPDHVLAIGRDAHMAIERLGIDCTQVRHPSYGGQGIFKEQIETAYDLSHGSSNSDLFAQSI